MFKIDLLSSPMQSILNRKLVLIFVAYHPSLRECKKLTSCLSNLDESIGYALVINDSLPSEPIDNLVANADFVIKNTKNLGYGAAVNQVVRNYHELPEFIGIMNTDLYWSSNTFESIIEWMNDNGDVVLLVPQILSEQGKVQKLCKRNPTILALLSRRFIPNNIKPAWLKKYDSWYAMNDINYFEVNEVEYLSGCCMVIRKEAFIKAGGFDENFFLYLEDADLTRLLSRFGRCVHFPLVSVVHNWGRGNYKSFRLLLVNLHSAFVYFRKWGLKIF